MQGVSAEDLQLLGLEAHRATGTKSWKKNTHNKPIITNNAGEVRDADLATEFPAKDEPQSEREKRKLQLAEKRSLRQSERDKRDVAVRIQKWYRGSKIKRNIVNIGIENLSRKIHDLDILIETLSKHGKSLIVPPKTLVNLMYQFLFLFSARSNLKTLSLSCMLHSEDCKTMQIMFDKILFFFMSSLGSGTPGNNIGHYLLATKHDQSNMLEYSIRKFVKICLSSIITESDIMLAQRKSSKENSIPIGTSVSIASSRVNFVLYILSSSLNANDTSNGFSSNVFLNIFQKTSNDSHWFIFRAIRTSIINLICTPLWRNKVLANDDITKQKHICALLSTAVLPIIQIGRFGEGGMNGKDCAAADEASKFRLCRVILDMFFSIPYFFLFIQDAEVKDFFLLAYPAIAIIGKDQLMLLDKPNDAGNNNYCNDDAEILHCSKWLSISSNISALFDSFATKCHNNICNGKNTNDKYLLAIKLQKHLLCLCEFFNLVLFYLPRSTFEADNDFIIVKKSSPSASGVRESSFRLPSIVVRQLHVLVSIKTLQFLMKYLMPVSWEPNPTVTKRIKEYTFLEKDLRTEEEAENRTLWGRVVKSATWAKRLFVKKRDVARESWETEGHEKNKGHIGNGKEDARIQSEAHHKSQQKIPTEDNDDFAFSREPYHINAFCSLYMKILWLWWPGMSTQMVSFQLLNKLAFKSNFVVISWAYLETTDDINKYILSRKDSTNVLGTHACQCHGTFAIIGLFTCVYNHIFTVLDDRDVYTLQKPLPIASLIRYILRIKIIIYKMFWETEDVILDHKEWNSNRGDAFKIGASAMSAQSRMPYALHLRLQMTSLLKALYDRNTRKAFCNENTFLISDLHTRMGKGDHFVSILTSGALEATGKSSPLTGTAWEQQKRFQALTAHFFLQAIPFSIPLVDRLRLFNHIIRKARDSVQGENIRPIRVRIKRSHVFEDGFKNINRLGPRLQQRLYVCFIDKHGNEESGIDAGGLFKEFWTSLSKVAFNVNYGLWALTDGNLMYPSPTASLLHGNSLELYEFLGRILGKAIFEGIVVNPNFTFFFLRKLLGKANTLSDLPTLDPDLYKNLMFLKSYNGDVDDLALAFTAVDTALGTHKEVPLIPNGDNIPVTNENKLKYIYMVAHYRLNVKLRPQCNAFIRGMRDVIPVSWLGIFSENELQSVISGIKRKIDINELQQHTKYVGGTHQLARQ